MKVRRVVVRATLALIGLLALAALFAIAYFYALFYIPDSDTTTMTSSDRDREYVLYVPESYDPSRLTPLVISLHPAALWPATQMKISQWNETADEHGFLVAYPSGLTPLGGGTGAAPKFWVISSEERVSANVEFISDLIDTLEADYSIDPSRIYVNGFSMGGAMAFALSCRLSDRIAAVAIVAGAHDQQPFDWCADARPMPMLSFHGTADPLVPFDGGRVLASPRPFPSILTWTAEWARRNGCGTEPHESAVTEGVTRLDYTDCAGGAAVVHFTLEGGGHTWPGGELMPASLLGATSDKLDATREMWTFFRNYIVPKGP